MKKPFLVLLILAAAIMLFASGYAYADTSEELIYDENDNTWAAGDEDLTELVAIMKRECAKSPLIKAFTATAIFQLCEQGKLSLDSMLDVMFSLFRRRYLA